VRMDIYCGVSGAFGRGALIMFDVVLKMVLDI